MTDTVLILGAYGSIGRALIEALLDRRRVIAVDRAVPDDPLVESLAVDLGDPAAVEEIVARAGEGVHLLHVAANLDNRTEPLHLRATVQDNLLTVSTPLALLSEKLAHITHLSSISVYGSTPANPIGEDQPLAPATPYGAAKAAGEMIVGGLGRALDIPTTIVRPAQLFGLRSARDTLPHQLLEGMSGGETMTLNGDPDTKRDYIWIGDFVELLLRQLEDPVAGVFNAGSGAPLSVGALFQVAAARFGADYIRGPEQGGFSQWLDMERTCQTFDFAPSLPVTQWLQEADPAQIY